MWQFQSRLRRRRFQFTRSPFALTRAIFGRPATGHMVRLDTTGFPAYGWLRLRWECSGRPDTGVLRAAFTCFIGDIGARTSDSMAALITASATAASASSADVGTAAFSLITRQW